MNMTDLYNAVAKDTGMSRDRVRPIVQSVFKQIADSVLNGENVTVSNFGTFEAVYTADTIRRNPQTGEPVPVPSHLTVRFRRSRSLDQAFASGAVAHRVKKNGNR